MSLGSQSWKKTFQTDKDFSLQWALPIKKNILLF